MIMMPASGRRMFFPTCDFSHRAGRLSMGHGVAALRGDAKWAGSQGVSQGALYFSLDTHAV